MQVIREKVKNFIDNFDDPEEKNLIFTGSTGVGKTYLTNCIANEVLKLGKTVLYQTAPVMFDEINDAKFGRENARFDLYENILNVDLLIIDDLGTEKITDTKITELFTIINTRLLNQNHKITKTIISTNLNVDELFKTYTIAIDSDYPVEICCGIYTNKGILEEPPGMKFDITTQTYKRYSNIHFTARSGNEDARKLSSATIFTKEKYGTKLE